MSRNLMMRAAGANYAEVQRLQAELDRLRAERDALLAEKNHLKDWKERAFKAEDEIDLLQAQNRAHLDTILHLQMEIARSKVVKTAKEGRCTTT